HSYVEETTVPATCVKTGTKTFTCTVCETTKTEDIPLAAHQLQKVDRVEPTTEKAGNIAYYHCTVCGRYFDSRMQIVDDPVAVMGRRAT
ncbi:MAG: hypothetical protein IKT17_06275, partial [Lachnospiraceae bacterium]|nr:hypothetical protein [Lachnospiraceae bacterium]